MITKKFETQVWFEKFTLRDKKSAFRVSEPDQHILKIIAKGKSGTVVLREFSFSKKEDMEAHYKTIRSLFEEARERPGVARADSILQHLSCVLCVNEVYCSQLATTALAESSAWGA